MNKLDSHESDECFCPHRQIWEKEISEQLNHHYSNNYVLLRTGQLVGTALAIYARADVVSYIRNVECAMKKVSLG